MKHFLLTAFILASLPLCAGAQTSIGYSDPADVSTLLDYRLPDWSYRVWDADFRFSGGGNDSRNLGNQTFGNTTSLLLGSNYFQAWESEQRYWSINADVDGQYRRSHSGTPYDERQGHDLGGAYRWDGTVNQFLGDGPFSVKMTGGTGRSYVEKIYETRHLEDWEESNVYDRDSHQRISGGLAWGRVRNVEPMLRAQRLSERLIALGRPPLATAQLHEIAAVWSQQSGYFNVYDRYGRFFWEEVLTPMLDPDNPLTAYEILYLMDAIREQLGTRRQGVEITVDGAYTGSSGTGPLGQSNYRTRLTRLSLDVYRNLSLTQQVRLSGDYSYTWTNSNDIGRDRGSVNLRVAHLWNLTDRFRLDTAFAYDGDSDIQHETRNQRGSLGSSFNIYLEDQLSLNASMWGAYNWVERAEDVNQSWNWTYGIGLVYHLDRAIF